VPVYARTTDSSPAPAVASATSALEVVPAAAPQGTPASVVSEAATTTSAPSLPEPPISQPAPEPVPAIASPAAVTHASPASVPPKESARPDFRLSGIIYTVVSPSAIVNGETVYVGDQVNGATVLSIHQTDVTLQVKGLRKTYTLR